MSEVVYADSGPKVEIEIEEAAIPEISAISTPGLGGGVDVKPEDIAKD